MNALVDRDVIEKLYEASQAGVQIAFDPVFPAYLKTSGLKAL